MSAVLPALVAVVLVAAVVGVLFLLLGKREPSNVTAPGASTPPAAASASTSPTPTPSPTSSPTPTTAPPATGQSSLSPSATPSVSVPRPGVVVLNQSREAGLASRTAAQLRQAGWTVAATGNFRGMVMSTTVYYPPGMDAAARELAADVDGPDRIRPVFGNLSRTRLTVVLVIPGSD